MKENLSTTILLNLVENLYGWVYACVSLNAAQEKRIVLSSTMLNYSDTVRPEPVEGSLSWFDRLTTNGVHQHP
jgi:hypothetical protein